ncbi:MAG: hypothetical protein K0Q64_1000 [Nitrobacter vulgaris]|nr:hypothetical protein [Nitrobacter vulgaris]
MEWLMHLAQAVFHQPKKEFGSTCKLTLLRREGEKPLASWAQGCILELSSPGSHKPRLAAALRYQSTSN